MSIKPEIRLAVVGWRSLWDVEWFNAHVRAWIAVHGRPNVIITSEDAQGADLWARHFASLSAIKLCTHKAEWGKYGRRAGPKRNGEMVRDCTHVLAFPSRGGLGTQNMIKQAKFAGKHVTVEFFDSGAKRK